MSSLRARMALASSSPDYTRIVAEYVDDKVRRVISSGTVVETQKAAILAALQITDELFKALQSGDELASAMRALSDDIRRLLPAWGEAE